MKNKNKNLKLITYSCLFTYEGLSKEILYCPFKSCPDAVRFLSREALFLLTFNYNCWKLFHPQKVLLIKKNTSAIESRAANCCTVTTHTLFAKNRY
jgi:hypothetical protein